jgi:phage-related protein (TIGR01555 family)
MTLKKGNKTKPRPPIHVPPPLADTMEGGPMIGERAVQDAPGPGLTPSMTQATAHEVDPARYTTQERKAAEHAMDFNGAAQNALTFVETTGFPGFPTLGLLGQLAEYRTMHETLADETVRMWGKVKAAGDAPPEKLEEIEEELKRMDLRKHVRQAVIHDQAYGGAHVYFKMKDDQTARDVPLIFRPYSVPKGAFEGVRVVEPFWVTPNAYNSIDPTAEDFYIPSSWWLLGIDVHATRLHTLISRPVADMLKPAYSFRGVSMTQLAMPYVDNWLRSRQSISDTLKQFSVSGVATDLQQILQPGAAVNLQQRAQLINAYRDNRNLLFLDKATEEFFQINTPLSGLDALQAQAQEQMAAVSHIPLVKLLGITPTGLNASSEGEIRVFYDYVRGYQTNALGALMQDVLQLVQLSLFGAIDPGISWEWEPLMELSKLEDADRRNKDAQTADYYVTMGALNAEQVAQHLAQDPTSGYSGLFDGQDDSAEPADDDIAGITQQILGIGHHPNDEDNDGHSSTGETRQVSTTDPAQRTDGSEIPASVEPGRPKDDKELSLVAAKPLQLGAKPKRRSGTIA